MWFRRFKRVTAFVLASVMMLGVSFEALAATGATSGPVTGGSVSGTNHTFPDYGIKVSFAEMTPMMDAYGIQVLENDFQTGAQNQQANQIAQISRKQMWPTEMGLNFAGGNSYVGENCVVAKNPADFGVEGRMGKVLKSKNMGLGQEDAGHLNQLAWRSYVARVSQDGLMESIKFRQEVYDLIYGADGKSMALSNFDGWLDALWAAGGLGDAVDTVTRVIDVANGHTASNLSWFTWTTYSPDGQGSWTGADEKLQVLWNNHGLRCAMVYFAQAARQCGDVEAYEKFKSQLQAWIGDDWNHGGSLAIVCESTVGIRYAGAEYYYMTGPQAVAYACHDIPGAAWYSTNAFGEAGVNTVTEMLGKVAANHPGPAAANAVSAGFRRIYGYNIKNGQATVSNGPTPPTHTGNNLNAWQSGNLPGYAVFYPFYADSNPDDGGKDPWGSFTWDLDPKGLIDKTPAEQINESSTITNLNISQNGYNMNNYTTKWEPEVLTDGSDCNQIQIDIYHISQNLPEGVEATIYDRSAVRAGGKPINTVIEKVVPGTAIITNVPSINQLVVGEKKQVKDSELLDILKTGTGLTVSETVSGALVKDGKSEGVRVTYAIYVTVWTACSKKHEFSNDQQWYVEYRSEPGTYIYESDDPEGWAEIKCGYFDRDRGYAEPFEAMAGSPTTENLYFVSGGQEFVAQITYKYVTDKKTIRNFEQKYTTETCEGWWAPVTKTFENTPAADVQAWLDTWTKSAHQSGEFINQSKPCTQCGAVHDCSGTQIDGGPLGKNSKAKHNEAILDAINGKQVYGDNPATLTIGDYFTECELHAVAWDWKQDAHQRAKETDPNTGVVKHEACSHASKSASDSATFEPNKCAHGTSGKWGITKATRYSGTVKSYHRHWEDNSTCEKLTSSIKFWQPIENFNYAQAQKVHVWRLEKSRVEGIDQLTMDGKDVIVAEIPEEELSQVIFNVAENDTAIEGRMYYVLHPEQNDNFVFKQTLKTRGCCHCHNHNAAEDLIASGENPNKMFEQAWVISDYLILQSSNSNHSLLYHEYSSLNSTNNTSGIWPICRISVSGTDKSSRQDNGYTITTWTGGNQKETGSDGSTDADTFYWWDKRGQQFKTDIISFNTSGVGGKANDKEGTMEKICENPETFFGGGVTAGNKNSKGLAYGGYIGDYTGTTTELAGGTDDPGDIPKYQGKKGKNNSKGKGDKKIFKVGYTHLYQGEVVSGITDSPQTWKSIPDPLMLVYNDIDVHDYDVHNGEKHFDNASIFYRYIISYKGGPKYETDTNNDYKEMGLQRKTNYSKKSDGINSVIIHNPVSAQYAKLIALPSELDQRTDRSPYVDKMNVDNGKCPGVAQSCKYAHINCQYNGTRYHTDECYAKVRSGGLATTPIEGEIKVELKPIPGAGETVSGSETFAYTGARQTFQAPETGDYTFEVWGASGGTSSHCTYTPGKGGYAKGTKHLNKGDTVYIYVGGQGQRGGGAGWNGGGKGNASNTNDSGGGGGATDIRVGGTALQNRVIVGAGGGGNGCRGWQGGNGGGLNGSAGYGSSEYSPGGGGASQTAAGWSGGYTGGAGLGQGASATGGFGCGGGGGGYYGGGANSQRSGGSAGGGGSSYIGGVTGGSTLAGQRLGDGQAKITWSIEKDSTVMVPEVSGDIKVGDGATPLGTVFHPQVFTAKASGMYSIHLYGARGGGDSAGKPSAGGLGGYAGGMLNLQAGQKVLVTAGGIGSTVAADSQHIEYEWAYPENCGLYGQTYWGETQAGSACSNHELVKTGRSRVIGGKASGGYNGGGHADTTGFGGGGATDIATNFVNQNIIQMQPMSNGASSSGGKLVLPRNAYYWGPRCDSKTGHIYRVDYWGENLDKASFDTFAYYQDGSAGANNCTKVHEYVTPNYAQIYYKVNRAPRAKGQEFRVWGNDGVLIQEMWAVDMDDRLLVAAGGGGADNLGGTLNGNDDGRGGAGGGENGANGYTNGVQDYRNAGAKATSGYLPGIGASASGTDAGAGGAGWYGGYTGSTGNSGGGGGSSNCHKLANGVTEQGQNSGSGYAIFIEPGKGDVPMLMSLSCSEPHHAPNLNYKKLIAGWKHEGGFLCGGEKCKFCDEGITLYSPSGFAWTPSNRNQVYLIQHNGELHVTNGSDTWCDQCGQQVVFDKYSTNDKDYRDCCWKATQYNAAAFSTVGATSGKYHYAFGDDTCYDPCNDDEKHKVKKTDEYTPGGGKEPAGQFVLLDYDFEAYFPNIGDFYGNGALGIPNTQKPEGWGYIDEMDTTIWLKEKYVLFPFDVTYNGHTYLTGEKVMLGWYDDVEHIWHDDRPDDYRYTFHCLMNNLEAACVGVKFVAVAKNTPSMSLENNEEDHNYTRYGSTKRAWHDAYKLYWIDVLGRIGVLSIEDTGDFRFSNYYKQTLEGWRVNQVVHEVDLGKQNFVSVDQKTIFNDPVSDATKGQNTWGLMDWMEPVNKLRAFPLTPGENNVKALKNQAHRIGYMDYMSLVTLGNYYGENSDGGDFYKVQIQPFYYYYNLKTKEWVPVDVYVKTGNTYKIINKYGSTESIAGPNGYNFYYDLNWEDENVRRMYTMEERNATENVGNIYIDEASTSTEMVDVVQNIRLPMGIRWLHGTANMLFLRDGNRTFIGSRTRYGKNTETDGRIAEVDFQRQGQRWNFTLGLPTQSAFVKKGEPCTPENIAKYDMEKGIIVVALDIISRGTVWTLEYDGTPVSDREFDLFKDGSQIVSWKNAGANGPEDKLVVLVYTDAKTSRHDLTTEGTH